MALAARVRWFELMGTLGGKWPHTGGILPGGTSRALERSEVLRLLARLREMRGFLERTLFGTTLEELAQLDSLAALQAWQGRAAGSDLALFLEIAADVGLHHMGPGPSQYLSYGAYAQFGDGHALAQGVWDQATQQVAPLDASLITEDSHSAWLADAPDKLPLHPDQGLTVPQIDKPGAYTWNKAPRLGGAVIETGAIARQLVDGHALIRSAVAQYGGSVITRVLARLVEVARVLPMMEQWLLALQPREPFHAEHTMPERAQGVGLSEAARGALGHWLHIERGRIAHYQIVAPTSWNFSPRDAAGTPGALESALVGTPLQGEGAEASESAVVQHIVRSFDPCMVCTVH
jgi:hydrogenase large subunit